VGDKVDCDTFDNELMSIREMIGNSEPSGGDENAKLAITTVVSAPTKERGSQLSTKDLNKIKEIIEKFPAFEDALTKITK
jgi:hypothetical protein